MRTLLLSLSLSFALIATAQHTAKEQYESAMACVQAGNLDSAMASVQRSIAMDGANAKALKLRGDIYQRKGDSDAALADYKASEKLDPNDPRLYVSRSALRITGGLLKTALKDCERAIDLDPTDADAFYNRACVLYLTNNVEGARRDAEKAFKLNPNHAEALYLSGVAKGELYHEEAGLEEIEAAIKMNPKIPGALMSVAVLLYEARRYEDAIVKFTEVIASDSTELAVAHYYRGDCYYNLDDKEKACEDFVKSMALGDKDATFIKKNYCDTDLKKIPKKPVKGRRKSVIQF